MLPLSDLRPTSYLLDLDLSTPIKRYRTGPFRLQLQVCECVAHEDRTYTLGFIRDGLGTWNYLHGKAAGFSSFDNAFGWIDRAAQRREP